MKYKVFCSEVLRPNFILDATGYEILPSGIVEFYQDDSIILTPEGETPLTGPGKLVPAKKDEVVVRRRRVVALVKEWTVIYADDEKGGA